MTDQPSSVLCPVCLGVLTFESALRYVPKIDSTGRPERDGQSIEFVWLPQGQIDPATAFGEGGGSVQLETSFARPLRCPHEHNIFGEEQEPHDLPEGIFERSSTIIGYLGPTGSVKSTLLALTAHHLEGSRPRAFREAGMSMTVPAPRIAYEQYYGDLVRLGKELDSTPKGQLLPWVTVEVNHDSGEDSNLILCDSAGENFDGRPHPDGYGSAAAKDMSFLVSARMFMVCVSPEHLDLKLAEPASAQDAADNIARYKEVERGIGFLIETQSRFRDRLPGGERNFELPWVCVIVTKADLLDSGKYRDPGPDLDREYSTTEFNVRYKAIDEELTRIREESRVVRQWLLRQDIELFDDIERRCLTDLYSDRQEPAKALFSGISYHAITIREGGANDNGIYDPLARHSRLLDPMVVALALDEKSRSAGRAEGQKR